MKIALLPMALALLAGCAPAAPEIAVSEAWARATAPGQSGGAVYATIANRGGADRLVGVTSDAVRRCSTAATMKAAWRGCGCCPTSRSPPGRRVVLAPGGTHVMLTGLDAPLAAGKFLSRDVPLRLGRSAHRHRRGRRGGGTLMLGKLRLILWGLVALAAAALVFLLTRPAPELPAPPHDRDAAGVDRRSFHSRRRRWPSRSPARG